MSRLYISASWHCSWIFLYYFIFFCNLQCTLFVIQPIGCHTNKIIIKWHHTTCWARVNQSVTGHELGEWHSTQTVHREVKTDNWSADVPSVRELGMHCRRLCVLYTSHQSWAQLTEKLTSISDNPLFTRIYLPVTFFCYKIIKVVTENWNFNMF